MNEIKEQINIEDMIYEIRGKQVMLASDVAKLYEVDTKRVNEVVKRNINRFPKSFCFQLTSEEIEELSLRSQFATLNKSGNLRGQHYKYLPYVLTEQGIMMLSGLLKSDIAVKVNIQIIDAFVELRKYITNSIDYNNRISNIETKLLKYDNNFNILFEKLDEKEKNNHIFFNGQIYDAYSKIVDILTQADKEVTIIDNYADKTVLDIISSLKVNVTLITKKFSLLKDIDIEKYNKQYSNLVIKYDNTFHDRYFILDNKIVYHLGSSINHAGSKTFSINKIEDEFVIESLIKKVNR